MTAPREIVCTGRLYADIVLTGLKAMPRLGREDYADDAIITPGGGAFITAAHLKALGRHAALASALGDDPVSVALETPVRQTGLTLALVERFAGGPQLTVALAIDGDRAFATRRTGPAAPALLGPYLRSGAVRHLHIGELATLRDAPWLLDAARTQGASVSLDVSWDDAVFADRGSFALAASADLVFPNAAEAAALTGISAREPTALLRAFVAAGAAVALKLGADGAAYADRDMCLRADAIAGGVVDATGAGDAFNAGFLDSWLDDAPRADCLAQAVACGTHAVRQAGGAHTLPARADIAALAAQVRVRAQPAFEAAKTDGD